MAGDTDDTHDLTVLVQVSSRGLLSLSQLRGVCKSLGGGCVVRCFDFSFGWLDG